MAASIHLSAILKASPSWTGTLSDNCETVLPFLLRAKQQHQGLHSQQLSAFHQRQQHAGACSRAWTSHTGSFTHAIRFGYTKFRNGITDATRVAFSIPLPDISITIGADPYLPDRRRGFFLLRHQPAGPAKDLSSRIPRSNTTAARPIHSHILRYGFGYNHIQGGGFAKFFGLAPTVNADLTDFNPANCAIFPAALPIR